MTEQQVPSIDAQRDYYDARWGTEALLELDDLERAACILRALADLNLRHPRILELGSGTGWLTGMLAHFGEATGVELSDRAVQSARQRYPWATFVSGDILATDFTPRSFDVAVSSEVIEHVPDQKAYVQLAASVLKPGGHLILTTPNGALWNMPDVQRSFSSALQPVEKWLRPGELETLLAADFIRIRLHSIVLGWGHVGWRRPLNSTKVAATMQLLGLSRPFDLLRRNWRTGLYLVATAQRRS